MQHVDRDRWPEDYDPDAPKSTPGSRRNSASLSRRNSATRKEKETKKKSPAAPSSANSTPKRTAKPQNLEFIVTGKQCLKKSDRANSLPGYNRRSSVESAKTKKPYESPKRQKNTSTSSKSAETSLEDDMSLDLSQVSDFEDTKSKYGIKPLATSTPKPEYRGKPRSASLQSQLHAQRLDTRRGQKSFDSKSRQSSGSDSFYKTTSASQYNKYTHGASTELDSSVSPRSCPSPELSPRAPSGGPSPRGQDTNLSSCCSSTWQDCSEMERTAFGERDGEWTSFWANYNNSLSKVPVKNYYDQCPTPYRTENIDLADLEFSTDGSRKRSPDNIENINYVIRNEGLHLTPRETQNIIKCAHILGNVLSKAIERRCREKGDMNERLLEVEKEIEDPEIDNKKKTLTLELKETNLPAEEEEEKKCEVTTQTDISLPNTKSAPRIFEKILRQLSKSSLEEGLSKLEKNLDNKDEKEEIETKKDN